MEGVVTLSVPILVIWAWARIGMRPIKTCGLWIAELNYCNKGTPACLYDRENTLFRSAAKERKIQNYKRFLLCALELLAREYSLSIDSS
jgi:hypothetical protein